MRWIGVAAVVAALAVAAAGCGGSSDSSSDAADQTTTEATIAIETTPSTEGAVTDSEDDASTEDTSTDDSPNLAGLSEECKTMAEASQKFSAVAAAATGGGDDDPEALARAFEGMAQAAPAEIKDDFEALAGLMSEYLKAIKDLGLKPGETPNAEQIGKLIQLSKSLGTEKAQKAVAAIAAWTTSHCASAP